MMTFFLKTRYRYNIILNFNKRFYIEKSTRSNCIAKYVFVSAVNNIFLNLALEDWLYQNYDFSQQEILLLWRNTPVVVIGRHQNPWLEANIKQKKEFDLLVARRNSGGGAVFHDLQNLNFTFFTSKESYNRRYNLEMITRSIKKEWGIDCDINSKEDIVYKDYKISGSASKLSRKNSYHHCTLLVDTNKTFMSSVLHSYEKNIITNATRSKPSTVINLRELNPTVNVERLMTVAGLEYLATLPLMKLKSCDVIVEKKGFHLVSPEEKYFPGINENIKQFQSWDWIFGRTPKFKTTILIQLSELSNLFSNSTDSLHLEIETENALVCNINIMIPKVLTIISDEMLKDIITVFYKQKYSENLVTSLKENVFKFLKNKLKDYR